MPVPVHAPRAPALPAPAPPSLRLLAEAVRCHVPIQPGHPRHGTEPVPVEIFYGPLTDPAGTGERRCAWSVRFVTSLGPGGRTRRWGWTSGRTLASALQAARAIQRAATRPPPGGSRPASTPRGEDLP
jgi:hypothetical protein